MMIDGYGLVRIHFDTTSVESLAEGRAQIERCSVDDRWWAVPTLRLAAAKQSVAEPGEETGDRE